MKNYFSRMKATGICPPRKPKHKIIWSTIGSFLGIAIIATLGRYLPLLGFDNLFIVSAFGASAVLVYGAPMAEFSQPRNLIGGHIISALIGVLVFQVMGDYIEIASALAVSLAIAAMHITRTLHPPGGAGALVAVIGGEQVHALGFNYVISPIFIGAVVLLVLALFVNNMSGNPNRHYPVYWW
jgi:CBS-domain-containing membrane protein